MIHASEIVKIIQPYKNGTKIKKKYIFNLIFQYCYVKKYQVILHLK